MPDLKKKINEKGFLLLLPAFLKNKKNKKEVKDPNVIISNKNSVNTFVL